MENLLKVENLIWNTNRRIEGKIKTTANIKKIPEILNKLK
jgi:hypothetical protein